MRKQWVLPVKCSTVKRADVKLKEIASIEGTILMIVWFAWSVTFFNYTMVVNHGYYHGDAAVGLGLFFLMLFGVVIPLICACVYIHDDILPNLPEITCIKDE
jgi:hypothetical protein